MYSLKFKALKCDCGQVLMLLPPDLPEATMEFFAPKPGVDILICNRESGQCSVCGRSVPLPAAEVFDLDRSEIGRRLEELADE